MANYPIITNSFMPLQPEFETNNDYYVEQLETNKESTLLFYQFKTNKVHRSSLSVIPDGCIDILFCCDNKLPSANICGSVYEYQKIDFKADTEYFGVRFLPRDMVKGIKYSIKELINEQIPLEDMLSIEHNLIEKMVYETLFSKRIDLFNIYLSCELFTIKSSVMKFALNKIYLSKGTIGIKDLASDIGFSERYMRKKFVEYIGMSPKLFSQIVKFQSSLLMLKQPGTYTFSDIIGEAGYYDQAHFINVFKKFGYMTPTQFKEIYIKHKYVS